MPDLGVTSIGRGLLVFVLVLFMCAMAQFIHDYWKLIYPIRKKIRDGIVAAPPPELTLRYHRDVFLLALVGFCGTCWALFRGFPGNPFTYATILIWIDLGITVHKWRPLYQKTLQELVDGDNGPTSVGSGQHASTYDREEVERREDEDARRSPARLLHRRHPGSFSRRRH